MHNAYDIILCELEQVINCQWTLDVSIQVRMLNLAEVRNGDFCCCDSQICREDLASLPSCFEEPSDCETRLTVMLSGCGQCPGTCCLQLNVGSSAVANITNSSLQIPEMLASAVSRRKPNSPT